MPEKNFEQQVQHTLDELRVVPGGKVWQEVEASLKKDRRRRIIIFWLPLTGILLLIGIGLAVYWNSPGSPGLVQEQNQQPAATTASVEKTSGNKIITPEKKTAVTPEQSDSHTPETGTAKGAEAERSTLAVNKETTGAQENIPEQSLRQKNKILARPIKPAQPAATSFQETTILNQSETATVSPDAPELLSMNLPRSWAPVSLYALENIPRMPLLMEGASWVHSPYYQGPLHCLAMPGDSKWHWGLTAGTGLSGLSNGSFLSISNQSLLMDNSAYQQSTTPPQTGRLPTDPSGVKPGVTIAAGFWASRTLNSRLSLLGGLDYRLVKNIQWVGSGYDSSFIGQNASGITVIPGFFRAGDSLKYKNRYQLLELPLLVQYRLNKNASKPLSAEAGIMVQYLLKAKAMNFLPTNVFYAQTSGYTNWGLGLRLGLEWKAFRNIPLSLNPQFNWQLNNLRPEAKDPSRLWNIGLGLRYKLK